MYWSASCQSQVSLWSWAHKQTQTSRDGRRNQSSEVGTTSPLISSLNSAAILSRWPSPPPRHPSISDTLSAGSSGQASRCETNGKSEGTMCHDDVFQTDTQINSSSSRWDEFCKSRLVDPLKNVWYQFYSEL